MNNLLFLLFLTTSTIAFAQEAPKSFEQQNKIDSLTVFKRLNINNISTCFSNNGLSDYNLNGEIGFLYPKERKVPGFYYTGFLWGGKVSGEIRVSGTSYKTSLQPTGDERIYRVRRDYKNGDLTPEINDNEGTETEIRNEYERDWNDWPANSGAPYEDVNKNGIYEPDIDIPGFTEADQTIWFKANDNNAQLVNDVFGCFPTGVELEATYWAYISDDSLVSTVFRKYRLKNISNIPITDMYCGITTDPDIGNSGDDYVGCDTLLNLAFAYNAFDTDLIFDNHPPALGFVLIQGACNEGNTLLLSSFNFINNADPVYGYPEIGDYNGTVAFYNLFQGILNTGHKYTIPTELGGGETPFPYSGNPITKEGWIEGIQFPPGNRNMGLSTGPFNLSPNESKEIIFAQIAAGGTDDISRDEGIVSLKAYAKYATNFYKNIVSLPTDVNQVDDSILYSYDLYQNYPNPFNATTIIRYKTTKHAYILIKVFDIIGREVKTLVDANKAPGTYEACWNGKNNKNKNVSSGTYFYSIMIDGICQSKKMVLLR